MSKNCKVRYAASPKEVKKMDTKALRNEFLIKNPLTKNDIKWVYSHYDRFMTGGVIPTKKALDKEIKMFRFRVNHLKSQRSFI